MKRKYPGFLAVSVFEMPVSQMPSKQSTQQSKFGNGQGIISFSAAIMAGPAFSPGDMLI